MRIYPFLERLHKFKKYPPNDQNSVFCVSWKQTLILEVMFLEAVVRAWRKDSRASLLLLFKPKWGCILIIPTCLKQQLRAQNPVTGREGLLCRGIARRSAQRTNAFAVFNVPRPGQSSPGPGPNRSGSRAKFSSWQSKVLAETLVPGCPGSSGYRPKEGAYSGSCSSDPSSPQAKPRYAWERTNIHVYPAASMRCEPVFQCRFGPIPRTVDPTGLVVVSLDVTHRGMGASSTLVYPTRGSNLNATHSRQSTSRGWKMSQTHKSFWARVSTPARSHLIRGGHLEEREEHRGEYTGCDGTEDNIWISKICKCVLKYFAPPTHTCINALRHSQPTSVWRSKHSSLALNIISPRKPFGLFSLSLSGHFLST